MLAVGLGSYLADRPDGRGRIDEVLAEDIRAAQQRGNFAHAAKLKLVLKHFLEHHTSQPT